MSDAGRRPIRVLPVAVAERIAAGEVIDRPAAAVKELIENALDAGARTVHVEIRGSGLELIRVSDDGHGIPAGELDLALARHATSKLARFDDLARLQTLGFRGEALPSIAAIAVVTILSAVAGTGVDETLGAGLTVRFGTLVERRARARARGTTVTVRDLFANLPARRGFLRPARTESARMGEVVRRYALGRPDVAFTLSFDGRPAFHADGRGDARAVVRVLYGTGAAESLAPVDAPLPGGGRLHGAIGAGGPWYSGRRHVALFVNGRWVRTGGIAAAVEAAYRPFAPAGRHPIAVLHVDVPPDRVDVNVHPAKLEVRLREEDAAADAVREAAAAAFGRTPAGAGAGLSLQYRLPLARRVAEGRDAYDAGDAQAAAGAGALTGTLRYHATARDGLIVAEDAAGLLLIDQHRAHERVLFEQLQTAAAGDMPPQALLVPALLPALPPLAPTVAAALAGLGFVLEPFGGDAWVARAVPAGLEGLDAAALAALVADALADADGWRGRLLAAAACRAAVKKGAPLEAGAARTLLAMLAATAAPAVCPHGSPVAVRLSDALLRRLFRW